MTDGLNADDRAAPKYTNPRNLELASPQSVTATRLDQLVYSPNCYIQIFRLNFFSQWGTIPQQFEDKVQRATDCTIEILVTILDVLSEVQELAGA